MKRALEVLNSLEEEGVIGPYAIGGAMAAVFYVEPIATFDLDIFLTFPALKSGLLETILRRHGLEERWNQWMS